MSNRSDTKSPYSEGLSGKILRVISIVYGIAFHESGALYEGAFFQFWISNKAQLNARQIDLKP
jgi:hypothetical protein